MAKAPPVAVTPLPADIIDRLQPDPASPLTFTANVNGWNLLFKPISDSWERYAVTRLLPDPPWTGSFAGRSVQPSRSLIGLFPRLSRRPIGMPGICFRPENRNVSWTLMKLGGSARHHSGPRSRRSRRRRSWQRPSQPLYR